MAVMASYILPQFSCDPDEATDPVTAACAHDGGSETSSEEGDLPPAACDDAAANTTRHRPARQGSFGDAEVPHRCCYRDSARGEHPYLPEEGGPTGQKVVEDAASADGEHPYYFPKEVGPAGHKVVEEAGPASASDGEVRLHIHKDERPAWEAYESQWTETPVPDGFLR